MKFDARRSKRLRLKRPAQAMTGLGPADLVDVGPESLALVHKWPAEKGTTTWVEFTWAGTPIHLKCEIRVSRLSPSDSNYRSGCIVRGGLSAAEFRQRVEKALESAPTSTKS